MSFQLDNFLMEKKLIAKEQMDKALAERGRARVPLIEVLDYLKFIDKNTLIKELEKHFRTKYIDLQSQTLNSGLLHLVPENLIKRYMMLPIELNKNAITAAMVDPFDVIAIDRVQNVTGREIKPLITTEDEFRAAFEKFYLDIFAEKIVGEIKVEVPKEILQEESFSNISSDNRETLIISLFNAILAQAVQARSTDVHIEPQDKCLLIRFRIDGLLHTVQVLPKGIQPPLISRIKVLAEMDIAETRLPQDGQIRVRISDRELDLRVSSLPALYGEKVAIRLLDKTSFSFGLAQLGMLAEIQSKFEDIIFKPSGIILVTGPTGSGKTTTLYSTLSRIRSPEKNILTLEDPIEYELLASSSREGGITQVQIHPKIGLTFANGLRTFLRQDPDVIMVGEIRDQETAEISITASMVGRLVLSTLHTKDTLSSISRLLNMGIEPYMVAHSIICVVTQRLLRTLCPHCKQEYNAPKGLLEKLGVSSSRKATLFREVGCPKCNNSGYLGRTGVFELLPITESLRELIVRRVQASELYSQAKKEGFKTLTDNSIELVISGLTTVSETMRILPGFE